MANATYCPATMCPLFASGGSPWTGEVNAVCTGTACGWFDCEGGCSAAGVAAEQVAELSVRGRPLVVGKAYSPREAKATTYDCARAGECQWQLESEGLCPPRLALSMGLDPRACAW